MLERVKAVLVPDQDLHGRDHEHHPRRHRQHGANGQSVAAPEQMPRARSPHEQRGGQIGGRHHVGQPIRERRIENHLQPIDRHNATIDDLKSLRRLHPAVGSENPGRRDQRAQRNHDGSEEVQGWSDLAPAKQRNTQKSGFEEEGSQHLICEQRSSDAAGESREIAPVGTKLVGHDQAGDDSHSEVHGEDFRPEMVKIAEDRDFLPQPQTLENDQIAREPDRDGGKDNVERDGESKLNSRQFQGT